MSLNTELNMFLIRHVRYGLNEQTEERHGCYLNIDDLLYTQRKLSG